MKERLLIVDDKKDMLQMIERLVSRHLSVDVLKAMNGQDALKFFSENSIDTVVLDIRMPGKDGMTVLKEILNKDRDIPVIILTGYGTVDMAVEALKLGAYDFLTKPVDNERLVHTIRRALRYRRLIKEKRLLEEEVQRRRLQREILGTSPAIKKVLEEIKAVATTDETVLILGETGTGKELAARTIHRLSQRAEGPFVTVNCPAVPENLLESELFGFKKGAFTSATEDKTGLIATAHRGTLFLDEIGDIPAPVQTKLLRFLQEKEFRPLGSTENITVDVRVIASTNQDLEKKIQDGSFREDLYYRLNVITIRMPSLEERKEDIPILADAFLKEFSLQYDKEINGFTKDAIEYLLQRPWKGNVRELQNVIKRAVIFATGQWIDRRTLEASPPEPRALSTISSLLDLPYRQAKEKLLEEFTTNYIRHLLNQTGGNVTRAAHRAGIHRQALQQLMRQFGISSSEFKKDQLQ
ncbi:MAG: sigma-54-dependent Fis family transcriptional regulator [Nitrospirae bacterium]|nr:MAG: sigma-54-dependent Fis family transcriptional regulator [Nitrospirota bacterium]